MKDFLVKDILEICNGKLICGKEEEICENFCKDTRKVQKGDVYVAIRGEKYDGNMFLDDAIKKGAKVCIVDKLCKTEEEIKKNVENTIILVENTIKALQELAKYKRNLYNIPVVAVTGSVGKTSTKDAIASVMQQKYNVLKTEGNLNNHIGLPLTILKLKNHDAMVVEMGMNSLGEISVLTNIAKPTMCVITNVTTAHIGILGSRRNILKAKLEILEGMEKDGTVIINNDNDLLHKWKETESDGYKVYTYGVENESNLMAKNIKVEESSTIFETSVNGKEYEVETPVPGTHFVYNSLCAMSVGINLGIDIEKIKNGIKTMELTKNRMDVLNGKNNTTIINGCYNASYDSVKAGIEYLAHYKGNKKIAVLGDMLELGNYAKELHEKVGEEIIRNKIDILVTVGGESKNTCKKAKELGMDEKNIISCDTREEAIEKIQKIYEPKDVILIKASLSMGFQEIKKALEE